MNQPLPLCPFQVIIVHCCAAKSIGNSGYGIIERDCTMKKKAVFYVGYPLFP